MASGNSSNANRYKGEDIDTDGDGSVNDAQTLQNNQPSDLLRSLDNETIQENTNGDIEVPPNKNTVLGDFENNSKGDWTGDFTVESDANGADNSNYFIEAYTGGTNQSDSRTFDLTNVNTLVIYFAIDLTNNSQTGQSNDSINLKVGTDIIASLDGGNQTSWKKYEADVSSYSGSSTLTVEAENKSGGAFRCQADKIKAIKTTIPTEKAVNGAGGT